MNATEAPRRFPFRIGSRSRLLLLFWGVWGDNAYAEIDTDLSARFGFYRFRTPLSNVTRWRIEGPWAWITAIGVRRGIFKADVSFAGSPRGGVRLDFRERVRWGPFNVPILYVGVEDLEGFAAALGDKGIPGEDARKSRQ